MDKVAMKKAFTDAVRIWASSNLIITEVLNRVLGVVGDRRYLKLVKHSENIDPLVDVSGIRAIRERMEREHVPPRYPNRIESVNSIYGIKPAIFGSASTAVGGPAVEHGLFLGDYIYPADTVHTAAPTCATFGVYRQSVIWDKQKLAVFCVGPYIHYAEPHYSPTQLFELKQKLGRTALVFLSHATEDSRLERPSNRRFAWIEAIAQEHDSVVVCSFWWDALDPDLEYLRSRGYHVVSCGLTQDRNFLRRQKTLLRLADTAAGDGIGTHVGYCLAEGVAFRLIDAGTNVSLDMSRRGWMVESNRRPTRQQILHELAEVLGRPESTLDQQREVAEPYWGFDHVKNPLEIQKIVEISREIALRSWGQASGFKSAADDLLRKFESTDTAKADLLANAIRR